MAQTLYLRFVGRVPWSDRVRLLASGRIAVSATIYPKADVAPVRDLKIGAFRGTAIDADVWQRTGERPIRVPIRWSVWRRPLW